MNKASTQEQMIGILKMLGREYNDFIKQVAAEDDYLLGKHCEEHETFVDDCEYCKFQKNIEENR